MKHTTDEQPTRKKFVFKFCWVWDVVLSLCYYPTNFL